MSDTVYIKLPQCIEVNHTDVYLGQIGEVWCANNSAAAKCKALKILTVTKKEKHHYVFSVMEVVELIQKMDAKLTVNNLGEMDFMVSYRPYPPKGKLWEWSKALFVCLITMIGASFAIMTFNNDGSVSDLFQRVYEVVLGKEADGFGIIELSYSLGMPLGIILFFNHFSGKAITIDPTPMEVQMRVYEREVDTAIIQNTGRKESGIDIT